MKKNKRAAFVVSLCLVVGCFMAATSGGEKSVNVWLDGKRYEFTTDCDNVGDFLAESGIVLKDTDYLSHTDRSIVYDSMTIVINIAKYVTVTEGSETYTAITFATTVREALESMGRRAGSADLVSPSADSTAYDGMTISVTRAKTVTFSRDGSTVKLTTYAETVGEFLREQGLAPTALQVLYPPSGTAISNGMSVAFINKSGVISPLNFGVSLSGARFVSCVATAYTNTGSPTASGAECKVGVVAVDPRVIPLGSRLYIESADGSFIYGFCVAADTGTYIKGQRVDLVMSTSEQCTAFGRKQVKVYILP